MDIRLLEDMLKEAEQAEAKAIEDWREARNRVSILELEMQQKREIAAAFRMAYSGMKKGEDSK